MIFNIGNFSIYIWFKLDWDSCEKGKGYHKYSSDLHILHIVYRKTIDMKTYLKHKGGK